MQLSVTDAGAAFPENVDELVDKLVELKIGNNPIPDWVWSCSKLVKLTLFRNAITELPAGIEKLASLRELTMQYNELHDLSRLGALRSLRRIGFGWCQIATLPPSVGELANLEHLALHHGQLTDLPAELANLPRLRVLYLSTNRFARPPAVLDRLDHLEELDMSWNSELASFSAGTQRWRRLDLEHTGIRELSMGTLPDLEELDISDTAITTLDTLAGLSRLRVLVLSGNKHLTDVKALAKLTVLERLDVRGTKIKDLSPVAHVKTLERDPPKTRAAPSKSARKPQAGRARAARQTRA